MHIISLSSEPCLYDKAREPEQYAFLRSTGGLSSCCTARPISLCRRWLKYNPETLGPMISDSKQTSARHTIEQQYVFTTIDCCCVHPARRRSKALKCQYQGTDELAITDCSNVGKDDCGLGHPQQHEARRRLLSCTKPRADVLRERRRPDRRRAPVLLRAVRRHTATRNVSMTMLLDHGYTHEFTSLSPDTNQIDDLLITQDCASVQGRAQRERVDDHRHRQLRLVRLHGHVR